MGVKRIVPNLQVADVAAAATLYAEIVGIEPVMDLGWIRTLASGDSGGVQLSLMSDDATATVIPSVSIEVDDVDAYYPRASRTAMSIVHAITDEAWGVRRFMLQDDDGNVLNILEHV